MGYVVKRGVLLRDGVAYEVGEHVPAMKGELSAQAEAGAVEWVQGASEAQADDDVDDEDEGASDDGTDEDHTDDGEPSGDGE